MNYTVLILRRAQRELAGIDKPAYDRIFASHPFVRRGSAT